MSYDVLSFLVGCALSLAIMHYTASKGEAGIFLRVWIVIVLVLVLFWAVVIHYLRLWIG